MNRREFVGYGAGAIGLTLMPGLASGRQDEDGTTVRTTMKIKLSSVLVDDQA